MRRVVAVAAALAALAMVLSVSSPPPAAAFPLTTCKLSITSYDLKGHVLSTASESNEVGNSQDNPVIVDPDGYVDYTASTGGQAPNKAAYHLDVFGMPTPVRGTVTNPTSTWSGRLYITDIFPFSFQGTIYVSGALEADGKTLCGGSAWVKINGNPLPGVLGGGVAAMIGLAGALWSARGRHPFRGIIAGALFGTGLAILSGTAGIMPFKEGTPIAEIVTSLIAGFAIGAIDLGDVFGSPGAQLRVADGLDARTAAAAAAAAPPPPANFAPGTQVTYTAPGETQPTTWVVPPPLGEPLPLPATGSVTPTAVATAAAVTAATAAGVATAAGSEAGTQPAGADAAGTGQPPDGLPQLQQWEQGLDPKVRAGLDPVFAQAQNILRTGPGTLNVSGQLINDFAAQAKVGVKLADGAILVGDGMARAVPFVENGKLSLSLVNAGSSTAEFVTGMVAEGMSAVSQATNATSDPLAGLRWFVDNVNTAVANAGQSVQSIRVTPAGIQVTTGPAVR